MAIVAGSVLAVVCHMQGLWLHGIHTAIMRITAMHLHLATECTSMSACCGRAAQGSSGGALRTQVHQCEVCQDKFPAGGQYDKESVTAEALRNHSSPAQLATGFVSSGISLNHRKFFFHFFAR